MKETKDTKKIVGSFVGRYITLGIIIGGISFVLENFIPQLAKWGFSETLIIFQSVLFIISTILAITLAAKFALKDTTFKNNEEAKKAVKPIKAILAIVAIFVMFFNLIYCFEIEKSEHKDIDVEYSQANAEEVKLRKDTVHQVSNIYLATKEIITILTYAYAIIYVEKMVETRVKTTKTTKSKKEEKED